jgi:hypothetical protein
MKTNTEKTHRAKGVGCILLFSPCPCGAQPLPTAEAELVCWWCGRKLITQNQEPMNTQTTTDGLISDPQAIELFLCHHQALLRASRADQAWQQESGPAFLREAVAQSVIDFGLAASLHSPSPHPARKGEQVETPQPEARHTWRLVQ